MLRAMKTTVRYLLPKIVISSEAERSRGNATGSLDPVGMT